MNWGVASTATSLIDQSTCRRRSATREREHGAVQGGAGKPETPAGRRAGRPGDGPETGKPSGPATGAGSLHRARDRGRTAQELRGGRRPSRDLQGQGKPDRGYGPPAGGGPGGDPDRRDGGQRAGAEKGLLSSS